MRLRPPCRKKKGVRPVSMQTSPPQSPPIGAIALLMLACFPYFIMLAAILSEAGGDPASYGGEGRMAAAFSELYALASGVLLSIVLGILLLIGWMNGEMPRWAAIGAGILYPLSVIAAGVAIDLSYYYPGGWLVLVPGLLAPVIALFAMWARLPALHAVLRPDVTSTELLGAIAILILVTPALSYLDELQLPARVARYQEQTEAVMATRAAEWTKHRQENEARFQGLTPDSSLWDYLNPQRIPDGRDEQALAGARQVKSRQTDAVLLLREGKVHWLPQLSQLDLAATPALCEAFGAGLLKEATGPGYDLNVGEDLERQLPNLKWLVGEHCNLDDGLAAAETVIRRITAVNRGDQRWAEFLAAIVELRRKR
jgi:hypothetical protein